MIADIIAPAHDVSLPSSPQPVSELAYQRLLRGWSQNQLARELYACCVAEGEKSVGICAETISRWERGHRHPSPLYRKHLCQLYHMTTEQLGLLGPVSRTRREEATS